MSKGFRAIYLSHPEVEIDPGREVTDWSLSAVGLARAEALATRLQGLCGAQVVSSAERKALETAAPLAVRSGKPVITRPDMHENDRSSTGYLPREEFEQVADQFFARPGESVRGWETAEAAQQRILREVDEVVRVVPEGPLVFVGHGAVGTLLWCALAGKPISRGHDQQGGGNWYRFDPENRAIRAGWAPMEQMDAL
ncbi:histidine phosphatase family protein [Sulfitobacter sp. BDSS02]|nr:histidine phosphatase family protein [Sulfitobacter sp. BDSS02]MBR9850767.1 histidine phosphatase family protein [Paracoccaceae bacterium]